MRQEKIVLNEKRNVTLTGFLLDVGGEFSYVPRRPAVLVVPGGGYQICSDREADPVALAYLEAGYHAFILRYSLGKNARWPNPMEDYEQAMALIRKNAEGWHIYSDKIAVIGFSAGGHLAACAATMSENRPDAAILGYAVVGPDARECLPTAPDAIAAVDAHTCPCFVFATRNDPLVPVKNSLRFIDALEENGVSFESHIYAYGPHGFSVCESSVQDPDSAWCSRVPNWVPDSVGWLRDMFGDFSQQGLSVPKCAAHVNGNWDEALSLDCTVGHLMENPQASELLSGLMKVPALEQLDGLGRFVLRDALAFFSPDVTAEDARRLDEQLRQIKNHS